MRVLGLNLFFIILYVIFFHFLLFSFFYFLPFFFLYFFTFSLYYILSPVLRTTENLIVKPVLWQEYGNAKGNPDNLWDCADSESF